MFKIATLPESGLKTDMLILFFPLKFIKKRQKDFNRLPQEVRDQLKDYFSFKDFKGAFRESVVLYNAKENPIQRLLLIGIGDEKDLDFDKYRNLGYTIDKISQKLSVKRVHVFLGNLDVCRCDQVSYIAEGIRFNHYQFNQYKGDKPKSNKNIQYIFVCNKDAYSPRFRHKLLEVSSLMRGVKITRDLANQPSNILTPTFLRDFIIDHFGKRKNITYEQFDHDRLHREGFNALLSVAKGSSEPPYMMAMCYKPAKRTSKKLVIVGKGVTFDSGGISIKPSSNMGEMKYDMAGAAAVAGFMDVVADLKPAMEITGIVPLVENMPGNNALKPGDIIRAYDGTTIEIVNTDAEGRLILADVLGYAVKKEKPDAIINLATLTGSVMVALGDKMAAIFSNSDPLAETMIEAGQTSGERLWRMPVSRIYEKEIESDVADIKNLGGRWGGSIHAAMFLKHFIGKTPWAHIDMAGTANDVKNIDYLDKGATGFGTRLLVYALKQLEKTL